VASAVFRAVTVYLAARTKAGSVLDTLAAVFLFREESFVNWISTWWQHVSATVLDGLEITVIGMALVFLTLGLIIMALVLLTRLPGSGAKETTKEQGSATHSPPAQTVTTAAAGTAHAESQRDQETDLAQVAAIAVALLRSQKTRRPSVRASAQASRWKQVGRAHQLGL
jgi:sodium pump decarboxylase gamma subunit